MIDQPIPAALFGTEVHKLRSAKLDQEYQLSLWLPPGYARSASAYPVVYLLDASLWFGMAVSTILPLLWGQEVPEVILAGIGYPHQGFEDMAGNRNRDFTPSAVKDIPEYGGAVTFLSVLKTELIPFVEENYRTIPTDRTIWGTSLGGLFVLYTFLEHMGFFQRYIVTSPALAWDLNDFLIRIKAMSDSDVERPTKVFLSVGSFESSVDHTNLEKLTQAFLDKNLRNLKIHTVTLDDETHFSQSARGYVTGLRWVFDQK